MKIAIYHVDAFTHQLFAGNPAAVCILPQLLPEAELHQLAREINLPVTAFLVKQGSDYQIRWITPEYELMLCGHGSLAAGFVILTLLEPARTDVVFHAKQQSVTVQKKDDFILVNFPVKNIVQAVELPGLSEGLGVQPEAIYHDQAERCFAVLKNENAVRNLQPDFDVLRQVAYRGITVTARGEAVDYVSRTFYPVKKIPEDQVTGAVQCLLVPYWAEQLGKTVLQSHQLSARGGELRCELRGDRVMIGGRAVLFMQGSLEFKGGSGA